MPARVAISFIPLQSLQLFGSSHAVLYELSKAPFCHQVPQPPRMNGYEVTTVEEVGGSLQQQWMNLADSDSLSWLRSFRKWWTPVCIAPQ